MKIVYILKLVVNLKSKLDIFVFIFLTCISFLVLHEMVHGVILGYYGCEDVGYGISIEKGLAYTYCKEPMVFTEIHYLAHSINEVIGYYAIFFYILTIAVFGVRK